MALRRGIGRFRDSVTPQELSAPITRGFLFGLIQPGVRVAGSVAGQSTTYTGTAFDGGQGFVRTMGGTNSPEALDVHANAPLKRNRSRALGQHRGQPYMNQGFLDA